MIPAASVQAPTEEIRCPVCNFAQRHIDVNPSTTGYFAVSHRCENSRCKAWITLLFDLNVSGRLGGRRVVTRLLEAHPRLGRDEAAMRRTYRQFQHLQDEQGQEMIELFVAVGLAFGQIQPHAASRN